jgi:hypothetical protein
MFSISVRTQLVLRGGWTRSSKRVKGRIADVVDSQSDDQPRPKKKKKPAAAATIVAEKDAKEKPRKKVLPSSSELKGRAANLKAEIQDDIADTDAKIDEFTDNTWIKTYSIMFRKLKRIMRIVETKTLLSESAQDIYALMALYNQMREVIADIRSMIDLSQNTQRITDQILYPLVRDISNNYVDAIFVIRKTLRANVESDRYIELKADLDSCLKEHAKYIQSSYERSSENLAKLLED